MQLGGKEMRHGNVTGTPRPRLRGRNARRFPDSLPLFEVLTQFFAKLQPVPDCIKSAVIIYNNLFDQRLAPWARLRVPPNDLQCHKTPDERPASAAGKIFICPRCSCHWLCQPYPPL